MQLWNPWPRHGRHPPAYSQRQLEELERANLFLLPLDDNRTWYRYHHLFAEVVRRRLEDSVPAAAVAVLHQRAGTWYEHHGLVAEAMHHALAADDVGHAAELIEQHGVRLAVRGQAHTVLGWINALPSARSHTRPMLALTHAVVLCLVNRLAESEAHLQDVERCARENLPPDQVRIILGRSLRQPARRLSGSPAISPNVSNCRGGP